MSPHYRHVQRGWVALAAVVPGILLALVALPLAHAPVGVGLALVAVGLLGLLFSSLTVVVDAEAVRVSFTGGVVRRRVALREVREVRPVRNPWYYGWGIHRYPGGWLWNVAGPHAVELVLRDGSRLRIGSDEPAALTQAIARAAPHASSTAAAPEGKRSRSGPWTALAAGALVLVGGSLVIGLVVRQMRDPVARIAGGTLSVETPFYGEVYRLTDVVALSLEDRLPQVGARTNGFAASGLLRGWFDVHGLGNGKLFVDANQPPFVLLRLRNGFAIVGFSDPVKTQALFDQLAHQLPQAVAARPHP